MITSPKEMLLLLNFGHLTKSTPQFKSHDKIFVVTSWTEIMTSELLFQNSFFLRKPVIAIFADVNKTVSIFVRTI